MGSSPAAPPPVRPTGPAPTPRVRRRIARSLGIVVVALLVLVGCGSSAPATPGAGDPTRLLTYERVWPDGNVETTTIWTNGRSEMRHGSHLERLTLTPEQLETLQAALDGEIPTDAPDASPKRTLTLGDGTVVERPRPDAGTVTELLDRYVDTHAL